MQGGNDWERKGRQGVSFVCRDSVLREKERRREESEFFGVAETSSGREGRGRGGIKEGVVQAN